jgi:hypothetical protein
MVIASHHTALECDQSRLSQQTCMSPQSVSRTADMDMSTQSTPGQTNLIILHIHLQRIATYLINRQE